MNYTQKLTFSMLVPTVMVAGAGSAVALGAWWIQRETATADAATIASYLTIGGWAAGLLTVVCVLACLAFTVWIRRTALHVLGGDPSMASEILARIADGHLSAHIPEAARGSLLDSLQRMVHTLQKTLGTIGHASSRIADVSREIADDTRDLNSRTVQTVDQLQSTAARVATLAHDVQQSVDAANHANTLSARAAEVATRGGQVVADVVETMDGINQSSNKIADIIGVIDGIAFQTNILALNAAVEAARAGEQGRGFAVVASEVRNLAGRSAQAAREIKALIEDSVQKVAAGSAQVKTALSTMDDIVTSVNLVRGEMVHISTSAQAQSQGMVEVNTAIHALDEMTRLNETMVEQSTAASQTLNEQVSGLTQAVSVFRP
ncbi:methyl-accepting chemotaxis protein [Rhodoferax sp.]|uniref:methyl-accepting chemotaxis protein n=1 Tax=Rhodoferax sp. TaxID=50421 RepID=UPI00260EB8EC|nr:methyl-accepting chemotaxis protein [Rhodoferax sp.]MDD2925101.1 methyl-accepting chemotaxis protein [Rhodoferax sp.]